MEFPLKAVSESLLVGVISALLLMILFFIPILNFTVFLFPIPLVVLGVRRGIWAGILGLVVSSALVGALINPVLGVIILILNVSLVTGLPWVFKKKMQMNECIVISAAGITVSVLAAYQAFSWMVGQNFFNFIWEGVERFFVDNSNGLTALIQIYERLGVLDKGYTAEQFGRILVEQMKGMIPLIPSALLISSVVWGTVIFLLSRWALKRFHIFVPSIPRFRYWVLPRGTGRGFLTIMLIALAGMFIGIPNFDVVFYTISALFSFIFAIQGLATVAFFLNIANLPGVVQVLILIAAFIFMSAALTLVGIFEQIFGFRKTYSNRPRG